MSGEYSVQVIQELERIFHDQKVLRPIRILRYEPGAILEYDIQGVISSWKGRAKFEIEKFVGGGYAGQVYKVKLLSLDSKRAAAETFQIGNSYALKIFVPPTRFGRWFRNFIFSLAFQGPFSLQANPAAVRASALWQKFIRRGAKKEFGAESAVADIYGTLVDPILGSCGEVNEWIEGRMWRFEVDDNLDARFKWKVGEPGEGIGSPEYRTKRTFMARLVRLMHEMGATELARQYEWWTLKSQPNALKRVPIDPDPEQGLTAVDFRAGLALIPFLPMCPADFRLIFQGFCRGSPVQFDRGNIKKLELFVQEHAQDFSDMGDSLDELKKLDKSYRDSLPDITHHHLRLILSQKLRSSIMQSARESWKIRQMTDEKSSMKLKKSRLLSFLFYFLGIIPLFGKFVRRLWARVDYRRHLLRMLTSLDYFKRASRARIAEILIRWHRSGRVSSSRALRLARRPLKFFTHLPLSLLPPGLHRFFSDSIYARQKLDYIFARPVRLYFNASAREKWLLEMVSEGEQSGILSREEARRIKSQIKEPFIQKYLKSLAVHLATLFVSETVFLTIAVIYVILHPEFSWQEASIRAAIILGAFQFLPVSPGSLVRGFYVTYLILRERNFKDYNIAFFLSFLKLLGYLAFPIQMAYRYPDLARFMAGHWATNAVHIVPVFGEKGAWLEHFVFDTFYNYPLTIRRRIKIRNKTRTGMKSRYWHLPLVIIVATGLLTLIDSVYFKISGHFPVLGNIWWFALWVPFIAAAFVVKWAGGASLSKRIIACIISGALIGLLYTVLNSSFSNFILALNNPILSTSRFMGNLALKSLWQMFLFSLVSILGALLAETRPVKPRFQ